MMKLTYRAEIDGLRAIAVTAVILYHAQITIFGHKLFKGGFIGVDIFFVISGYLITSIILKELITTGTFSFKDFYERRVRRILPVLLFVMLVSLPFAWMYLLPNSLIDFSKSILYSLGFGSNFFFHYSGLQYGADDGLLKPFLHTWSLSLEEQFYILFPIVLLITFKYFRKYFIHILIFSFVISLVLAEWGSRNHPSFNFYVLPTRGWELLAGSMLAYFEFTGRGAARFEYKILNLILPSVGLFLIGHSILFFNDKMFHPSFYTLSPIIGVCLIIWFSDKNEMITKVLSTKLFVGIGLISYSLYLWHYPIFAFSKITEFKNGQIYRQIFLGITIFVLSIISYFLIELPARKNKKFIQIFILVFFGFLTLIFINTKIILKQGFSQRVPLIISNSLTISPWNILNNNNNEICHNKKDGCKFTSSSNKKVYVIGDSHMGSLLFDLKNNIIKKNYSFITSTLGGCILFPGFNKIIKNKIDPLCNNSYFSDLINQLDKENDSIIIIGGRYQLYFDQIKNNQNFSFKKDKNNSSLSLEDSFKNAVKMLAKKNKIILLYPKPELGFNLPNRIFNMQRNNKDFKNKIKNDPVLISYNDFKESSKLSFKLLESINDKNIYKVKPHLLFCNNKHLNKCTTHNDKFLFYYDDEHPSLEGAMLINNLIIEKIKEIEDK